MRQRAEPAVGRALGHGRARQLAQARVERGADVGDRRRRGVGREQARRAHQRLGVFLVAQMADGDELGVARRVRRAQRRRRLDDHPRLGPARVVEPRQCRFLQHDDPAGTLERMPGSRVNVEVAIEVGAGQDDDDRQRRTARARAGDRGRRAARVQGDEQVAGVVARRANR